MSELFIPLEFTDNFTSKHGIDVIDIAIRLIPVLNTQKNINANYDRLKSFICCKLKRGITPQEDVNLMQGILNYIRSEPMTNEREDAMRYLFETEFLL